MDFPLARQRFYQEIHQPDEEINLARAALYLAQEEYPDLDVEEYLNALDTMASEIAERQPQEAYPLRTIKTINQYLYEDLKFHGNTDDYYDPDNSYLNQVIDRRAGIPITLSLVYLEVARRLGFPMVGVGMPGHFLIRPVVGEMQIFVDPFRRGEVMFAEDCQQRLSEIYGRPIELRPEFLEPVTARYFLARMLNNLKAIYLTRSDIPRSLATIERILLLFPDSPTDQRDRGLLYYQTGRWTEASQDLEDYLLQTPDAQDAVVVQELLRRMGREV
ncbi:SirB1 family protein [Leptolyngbya sp. FACHB-711]|uniref:SirB1 family protein n=1 Tax=unclassified Leptolyngbya TaxID=2650499 RepID=UPI001682F9C5|nr:SirB1 family protein [Leptolyngbya sp. FACHB-711]MBD1852153.1 SirB1 family protein [Cyanobacteria bacterium FACHB-502]MBD2027041.1 SirB1 family protein [Leptolyngbya sp. FACHB-711]